MYSNQNLDENSQIPNGEIFSHNLFSPDFEVTKMNTVDSYISNHKESIDNLYDTLKNQISPQKISKNFKILTFV